MTKMIDIQHLKKTFGENEVLKDISATVNKGQVICIIGPSGSGKSTFLRCLNVFKRWQRIRSITRKNGHGFPKLQSFP